MWQGLPAAIMRATDETLRGGGSSRSKLDRPMAALAASERSSSLSPSVRARASLHRTSAGEATFALAPADIGAVDWLFSDIVCYPERLFVLLSKWINSGLAKRIVATVKFQGETDFSAQARFAAIPGSSLMHLHHNKHELTWVKLGA